MKLLKITSAYPSYINYFYNNNGDIKSKAYREQKRFFEYDEFSWFGVWQQVLKPHGYEVEELMINAVPLQLAWAKENGIKDNNLTNIALCQVKKINPDILWYDHLDETLIKLIKQEVPSIKLSLGWVGSAIEKSGLWKQLDLILTCAPESVERLRNWGLKAEHLNHGFDFNINKKLKNFNNKNIDLSFIGQIVRGKEFHLQREKILERLSYDLKVDIYSPSSQFKFRDDIKAFAKINIYDAVKTLQKIGFSSDLISKLPKGGKVISWESRPLYPVNKKLKKFIKEPVYGMEMFEIIRNSKVALNIHADSSPKYASNMRLFEITGIGTCMVVDYKENIRDLFEPDHEIITYKSIEECIEKAKWLINHPKEREKIAKAGQERTFKEHTFQKRAERLDYIIRTYLRR